MTCFAFKITANTSHANLFVLGAILCKHLKGLVTHSHRFCLNFPILHVVTPNQAIRVLSFLYITVAMVTADEYLTKN